MFTFPITLFSPGFINELSTQFNGIDEDIDTPKDFSGDTSLTITGWFNRALATQRIDIAQSESANVNRLKLILDGTGPAFAVLNSAFITSPALGTGWIHLGYVYDGSLAVANRLKLYVDGVQSGSLTGTPLTSIPTITGANSQLRFGKDNGSSTFSDGNLDEIGVWSVALSDAEILEVYNSGKPTDLTNHSQSLPLTNWWRMGDGDNATTVFDNVGSDDGTLNNMDASNYESNVP